MIGLAGLPELVEGDDLGALIADACARVGGVEPGDVVVVAQKAVSKIEGRVVGLDDVVPLRVPWSSPGGRRPSSGGGDPARGGRCRPLQAATSDRGTRHGFVCASAGVDASNAPGPGCSSCCRSIPTPPRPRSGAPDELTGVDAGVVVSDSFGRAWRQGTTDVALGVAGITALRDLRGTRDSLGYELRSTMIAVADEIAGAAELVLGKAAASRPRSSAASPRAGDGRGSDLVMPRERDLFS